MRALNAAAGLLLVACAQTPPPAPLPQLPSLQLSPASFGASLSLAQRLTVQQLPDAAARRPAPEHSLEAQLEIEPAELRLAAFALNQRVLTLRWDGRELQAQRHRMLPEEVDAARVLRDVQLVYWPLAAVAAALPAAWQVSDEEGRRSLRFEGRLQVQIDYAGTPRWQGVAELDNRREGYRLRIESAQLGGS